MTGFLKSRYNESMNPTTEVQELTPAQIKEMRDRIETASSEGDTPKRSKTAEEIRNKLDAEWGETYENLTKSPDQAESDKPKVPNIVLQERGKYVDSKTNEIKGKKNSWEDLGWTDTEIDQVSTYLRNNLHLRGDSLMNALEILVGAGTTGADVIAKINNPEIEGRVAAQVTATMSSPYRQGEDPEKYRKFYLLQELGVANYKGQRWGKNDEIEISDRDDYIKHFVLIDEFKDESYQEYMSKRPRNLDELAWNIAMSKSQEFGLNGKFPVLKMQIEKDENGKVKKGKYVVNYANFVRWMYWQINEWYNIDTDEVTNYFEKVKIIKDQFTSIDLGTILYEHTNFFTDEENQYHSELYKNIFLIPWTLMFIRTYDLQYQEAMSSGRPELAQKIDQMFFLNKLTRKTFQKSMMYYLSTMPVDLAAEKSDTKMGAAWMKMFLAYYNIADLEGLKQVFGEDNDFFKRDKWMELITAFGKDRAGESGMPSIGNILGRKAKNFEDAFTNKKDGKIYNEIQNRDAFLSFINPFGTGLKTPPGADEVVRRALRRAVADTLVSNQGNVNREKFKKTELNDTVDGYVLDEQSMGVVELIAQSLTRFTGAAARADFPALAAYDNATVLYNTEAYRRKMATKARGGSTGNPYTIPQFKRLVVPFLEGITVDSQEVEYKVWDEKKKEMVIKKRYKTPLEIMNELVAQHSNDEERRKEIVEKFNEVRKKLEKDPNNEELQRQMNALRNTYKQFEENETINYKTVAEQISFDENAMRDYSKNHFSNGVKLYDQLFSGQEIDFEKFTVYDSLVRGVSFKRVEFQKEIKENFLKPLRYLYQTYDSINMNMMVRAPVFLGRENDSDKWEFREMPLGEAIFGYQILNIPEFRMEVEHIKQKDPEMWTAMVKDGYKKKGKYIKGPDGKFVIDYDKVQENKVLAYKQWALMKIGADLWSHISRHSTDPAFNMHHFMSIIEAIESIAGEIDGSDEEMTDTRMVASYFSEEQMKWLKKISRTTGSQLFRRQFFADIVIGDKKKKQSLFGESAALIFGAIFKGR